MKEGRKEGRMERGWKECERVGGDEGRKERGKRGRKEENYGRKES